MEGSCIIRGSSGNPEIIGKKGVSLIEVVLSIVLMGMVMSSFWGIYQRVGASYYKTSERMFLLEDARMISSFIEEEVRAATGLSIWVEYEKMTIPLKELEDGKQYLVKQIRFHKVNSEDDAWLYQEHRGEDIEEQLYEVIFQRNTLIDDIQGIYVMKESSNEKIEFSYEIGEEVFRVVVDIGYKKHFGGK